MPIPEEQCTGSMEHRAAHDRIDGTSIRLEQARYVTAPWIRGYVNPGSPRYAGALACQPHRACSWARERDSNVAALLPLVTMLLEFVPLKTRT
jgi:hypothetical protein